VAAALHPRRGLGIVEWLHRRQRGARSCCANCLRRWQPGSTTFTNPRCAPAAQPGPADTRGFFGSGSGATALARRRQRVASYEEADRIRRPRQLARPASGAGVEATLINGIMSCDLVNYARSRGMYGWATSLGRGQCRYSGQSRPGVWLTKTRTARPHTRLWPTVQAATRHLLTGEMKRFLAGLPAAPKIREGGAPGAWRAMPLRATRFNRFWGRRSAMSLWESELVRAGHPEFLFLATRHLPMKTSFSGRWW